jgi:hypothetical protein
VESKPPQIADAKELATRLRLRGVLVLGFEGGRYAVASYGHTRATCDAMRRVADDLGRLIESGELVVPDELREGV